MKQGNYEKLARKSESTHTSISKVLTIFASFVAGFDFLQVLFQHYEHCTHPLQLFEFYGGATAREQGKEEGKEVLKQV